MKHQWKKSRILIAEDRLHNISKHHLPDSIKNSIGFALLVWGHSGEITQ